MSQIASGQISLQTTVSTMQMFPISAGAALKVRREARLLLPALELRDTVGYWCTQAALSASVSAHFIIALLPFQGEIH